MSSKKERRRAKRRADKHMDEAWHAAAEGNYVLARKLIARALERGPMNARFWLERARIEQLEGSLDCAQRSVRHALLLSPNYDEARALLLELEPHEEAALSPAESDSNSVVLEENAPGFTHWTARYDWTAIAAELDARGLARLPALLDDAACLDLRNLHDDAQTFEHSVALDDERGRVSYRFFASPLPALVTDLRTELYARLATIANAWDETLGRAPQWPRTHELLLERCRAAGQWRQSVISLHYPRGGFNAFHTDIVGDICFPFQCAVSLGPARAADGGELALLDVRPGKRLRIRQVATDPGDAVVFSSKARLVRIGGLHGLQAVRHGVLEVSEERFALGIPFHTYRGT